MIKILIIDDNLIIRHMLKMHIELDPTIKVVGENEINARAIDLVSKYAPDIVIVDFDMLGSAAKEVVEQLHQSTPETPILATSLNNRDSNLAIAKEAGAVDFVAKQADIADLIKAIHKAVDK
jgi:two-component system, NarL family, invasion response regulator UvrY